MYSKSLTKSLVADPMKQVARYILSIVLCLLLRPGAAEAVKVELDTGSSTSTASMSVNAYSIIQNPSIEPELFTDSDSWSGSGTQYQGLADAYQAHNAGYCGSSVAASVSVSSDSWNAYPEPGEQSIEDQEIYDIRFFVDCTSWPCPAPGPEYITIRAGYDCTLDAEGSIVWEILPSTETEQAGTSVIVSFRPWFSLGGNSGGTVYEFQIYEWEYGVIGKGFEGPYEISNYADPPNYGSTPVPDWQDLEIDASIGDKIKLSYKMAGYAYTQDSLVPSNLNPDPAREYPTMELSIELSALVTDDISIEIEDPVWSGESDRMVLPYDKVDLDFVVHNHGDTDLFDVPVMFKKNTNSSYGHVIIFDEQNKTKVIDFIAAGGSTIITNSIRIAGVENKDVLEKVIDQGAWLFLHDAITATVVKGKSFALSPRDKRAIDGGLVLAVQYPDFMTHSPDVTDPEGDVGNFYNRGGGDVDFHHPDHPEVRRLAIEASMGMNKMFPDDPDDVAHNIYEYIRDQFKDDYPCPGTNDVDIAQNNLTGKQNCVTQAYLLSSLARTIGLPSGEINMALYRWIKKDESRNADQHALTQIWYNGRWHFYDSMFALDFTDKQDFSSYLNKKIGPYNYIYYSYYAAYTNERRTDVVSKDTSLLGHTFGFEPEYPYPQEKHGWFHLSSDTQPGFQIETRSPVLTCITDSSGRRTGCLDGTVFEEIPSSYYVPEGSRAYPDSWNPDVFIEANESIFVATNDVVEKYSLVLTGTDDGKYELILYKIQKDTINSSTIGFDIRKDETHTYDLILFPDGEVSITGVPARVDVDPDMINLGSKGKWITICIELPESYPVDDIDIETIILNQQVPAQLQPMGLEDCDNDGFPDLMVKFDRSAVQQILQVGDEVEITVAGELTDGTLFKGSDTIRVIDNGGKKK